MTPGSSQWRSDQLSTMLTFAEGSRTDHGFAWLDAEGRPRADAGLQMWINARMTHVFSLATLLGRGGAADLAAHGVRTLRTTFADVEYGGWLHQVALDGQVLDATKSCYDHSFVLLAAASATAAGVPEAHDLLVDACEVHRAHFWDEEAGACRESWDRSFTTCEDYRGANSNMHTVEAYLVVADVTGQAAWRQRALEIVERLAHGVARAHDWRLVEHFTSAWEALPEHNRDRPDDPFRPYGATPGHGFEWSRLMVQLEAALPDPPAWLLPDAVALFARAASDGLCYTTDWAGRPVVEERFHWVLAEALQAADALGRRTGEAVYAEQAAAWWQLAADHFVDPVNGSWHHELSPALEVSTRTWDGKPDAYHVVGALLAPDLPLAPTAAVALAEPSA
ncbi:AGE family epimerase/isomerase [Nocardioides sp.]|uniref:AGE family epimerase/isomerase n=1 Tax=Nocardioides sp. TaxID=35761 RepID=UPI003D10A43A